MGNHTKPWEPGDYGRMEPSSYTMGENWGAQINFMVPIDREVLGNVNVLLHDKKRK